MERKSQKPLSNAEGFLIYRGMQNVRYLYSSVHVEVPSPLSDTIVEWGQNHVHDDDIFVVQSNSGFGREDEIHVTILYGLNEEHPDLIKSVLEKEGPLHIRLGQVVVFTSPYDFDVVVIEVISEDLRRLNEKLKSRVPHSSPYSIYNPHITIAYVKEGRGWKHWGDKEWMGMAFEANEVTFSSKNGLKTRLPI